MTCFNAFREMYYYFFYYLDLCIELWLVLQFVCHSHVSSALE